MPRSAAWEEETFPRVPEGRGLAGRRDSRDKRRKRETEAKWREEMSEEAPCIRLLVSGAATYDFIGCLPLRRLDESKDMIFES